MSRARREAIAGLERGSRARRERECARLRFGADRHVRKLLRWREIEHRERLRSWPRLGRITAGPWKGWYDMGYVVEDETAQFFRPRREVKALISEDWHRWVTR